MFYLVSNTLISTVCNSEFSFIVFSNILGLQMRNIFKYSGSGSLPEKLVNMEGGVSTYLGAAPIVACLERYEPNVLITSRVADAALFLAPMVYELGWNWDDLELLAQGSLAGHLLECGCQLTGGYFMHPADKNRNLSFPNLLDLSLPYAEISSSGEICVMKAEGSGGILNFGTCAEQLLYEVGDPSAYITPDVVVDFRGVTFQPLSRSKVLCIGAKPSAHPVPDKLLQLIPKHRGWKGWGEISYGGYECVKRAKAAELLVRSWMEEAFPGVSSCVLSYIIGLDSLKATSIGNHLSSWRASEDIRLRMDGLFQEKKHAQQLAKEFTALYTNGPAGGGGISTGVKKEIFLEKQLISREHVFWRIGAKQTEVSEHVFADVTKACISAELALPPFQLEDMQNSYLEYGLSSEISLSAAQSSQKIPLYSIAHSRAGDKGNDLNFSVIPHCPQNFEMLKLIITPQWVKSVISVLPDASPKAIDKTKQLVKEDNVQVEIYEVHGIQSLNVVVRNILDGGVNCSRRIDRHGKCISDLILCQHVVLPQF
ncbi:Septin spn6 [Gossypium arboreum]|uniref:Septin spn6 n=1 Tax=Gossypium arboreum TaxID=29729 RepID=A0A0B0N994_GOSAR|nr:Septin spn6 [Gossypium arboreum]